LRRQSDPLAPSMATMDATHKQVTTPRARFRLGANDGARAFGADADDDGVVAAAPAAMVLVGGAG